MTPGGPTRRLGLLHPLRALRSWWRGSLLVRVTATTLLLSSIVVGLLGVLLLARVTAGLLDAKERVSIGEATAGVSQAQRIIDATDPGADTTGGSALVDALVTALAGQAGSPGQFEVLLLATAEAGAPERGTNLVEVSSVPTDLRSAIQQSQRQSWTYTEIRYVDGRVVPGLAVGAPVFLPTVGSYELYHLFPLNQEAATLDLVRSTVLLTGALLVLLLVAVAYLVTRQVVRPVRVAAATAREFSAGHFEGRMQVRGEDDLARLAVTFNEMAANIEDQIRRLEDLSHVQQRFVSDVSHELRTPLTTIRMAADLLHDGRDAFDPSVARAAELLQAQLDRFEVLLADLLEISRYDAGAAVLEASEQDLCSLVDIVVSDAAPLAERRSTRVEVTRPDDPCRVECDPRRIGRILRNLVVNAIEHSDGRPVEVRFASSDEVVAVTVRDHGAGMDAEQSARVFDRFWRADPARTRATGGTGLGLSIALEDARLHGGALELWSRPGRGTTFRLTLPRIAGGPLADSPLALVPTATADDADLLASEVIPGSAYADAGADGPGPTPARSRRGREVSA